MALTEVLSKPVIIYPQSSRPFDPPTEAVFQVLFSFLDSGNLAERLTPSLVLASCSLQCAHLSSSQHTLQHSH